MTVSVLLRGCQPTPVLDYLKALGILRLVSEQVDATATGAWTAQGFEVSSSLDLQGLRRFLLEDYEPTPIVAPWNGRSGFFHKNYNRDSEQLVARLRDTELQRLEPLQMAIRAGYDMHTTGEERGWIAADKDGKLKVVDKDATITFCRNNFPDAGVTWLDSVAALASEAPAYSILLGGSGGNLGSLDLSNNWYQHLATLLLDAETPKVSGWLDDALNGTALASGLKAKVGQLDPGRAGGIGRQRGNDSGSAAAWVNPWDFVLGLEGSLLFASAIARRTGREGSGGRSALPFTVAGATAGARGGADDESVRGEVWLPLWEAQASLPELARLFGEARVQWDGRQAGSAIDFASAVSTLGTDRGLQAFERLSVAERLGQSSLAVPAGRVAVADRPEVRATVLLDRWLRTVERAGGPNTVSGAVRRARSAQWNLAEHGGGARLAVLLTAVADVEAAVSRSGGTREKVRPVLGPKPNEVLGYLMDATPEVVAAFGLASLRDAGVRNPTNPLERAHSLRACVTAVAMTSGRWKWLEDSPPPVTGIDVRQLFKVLADVLVFRSRRVPTNGDTTADVKLLGVNPWFDFGWQVPAAVAEAMAGGQLDWSRLRDLVRGLLLLDWDYADPPDAPLAVEGHPLPVPAHRLLAPFFSPRALRQPGGTPTSGSAPTLRLRPQAGWARLLATDRVAEVSSGATFRLRVAGLIPAVKAPSTPARGNRRTGRVGPHLAAATLLHLHPSSYQHHLRSTTRLPDQTVTSTPPQPTETVSS